MDTAREQAAAMTAADQLGDRAAQAHTRRRLAVVYTG
jgi:hypothetical protein